MPDRSNPSTLVVHCAQAYHQGLICPAETWQQIRAATEGLDVIMLLNDLNGLNRN